MGARPLICFVTTCVREGFEGRYLLELARRVDPRRYRLRVVSVEHPGELAFDLQRQEVPLYSLDLPGEEARTSGWWTFSGVLRLVTLLRAMQPDLVHAVGARGALVGRLAANLAGVRSLVATHCGGDGPLGMAGLVARLTGAHLDLVLAPGEPARRDALRRLGVHPARVHRFEPGVDLTRVQGWPPAEDLRGEGPLVGYLGRLSAGAGLEDLVEAARRLRHWFPGVRVVLAGQGPVGLPLLGLVRRLGLTDTVVLPGLRRDAGRVLAALDVFVHPARRGGWSLGLLEAMAAGRPVVVTGTPAHRLLVHDRVHGLMVAKEAPHELARAVRHLLDHPVEARTLGAAARDLVERRFQVQPMVDRHEEVYRALLEAREGRASTPSGGTRAGLPGYGAP